MRSLAAWSYRHRWIVVGAWLVAMIGAIVLNRVIGSAYSNDFNLPNTESTRALDLLREMQRRRTQMAIVMDDHGGISGLVTVEDLIEELVGDIMSEDDVPEQYFTREPAGTILVQGWAAVRKVNRDLHLDLPVGRDRTTIAGLCMSLAQAIPQAGERLTTDNGTVLEVIEASPRRVRRVRIHPVAQADEPATEEPV